jgi:hypothetical protein
MTNQTVAHPVMSGDPAAYPGQLIEQDLIGKAGRWGRHLGADRWLLRTSSHTIPSWS